MMVRSSLVQIGRQRWRGRACRYLRRGKKTSKDLSVSQTPLARVSSLWRILWKRTSHGDVRSHSARAVSFLQMHLLLVHGGKEAERRCRRRARTSLGSFSAFTRQRFPSRGGHLFLECVGSTTQIVFLEAALHFVVTMLEATAKLYQQTSRPVEIRR